MTSWTFGASSSSPRAVTHAWLPDAPWTGDGMHRACYLKSGPDPEHRITEYVYEAERARTATMLLLRDYPQLSLCAKCDKNNGYGHGRWEYVNVLIEFGALTGQDPVELTHTFLHDMTVGELDRMADYLGQDRMEVWHRWLATRPRRP